MTAEVRRGHLECRDERGSYRIPLGRRSRKCLAVLDKREGEFVRSLELDLFTGFVYYCVDNATSGGLSYYYDMSSKKVGHYFIHRYIRNARNHGFTCTPLESEVYEKLPCDNWVEEVEKLPGWKEAIENRVENLLLPGREVIGIRVKEHDCFSGEKGDVSPAAVKAEGAFPEISSISFFMYPAVYPAGIREFVYAFDRQDPAEAPLLLYRNKVVGNEFFGEDGEFEIYLTGKEDALILHLTEAAMAGRGADLIWLDCSRDNPDAAPGTDGARADADSTDGACADAAGIDAAGRAAADESASEALRALRKEHDGEEMVLKEMAVCFADGREGRIEFQSPAEALPAQNLRTILHGMLRREVNLS